MNYGIIIKMHLYGIEYFYKLKNRIQNKILSLIITKSTNLYE